jgi:hypothetical protein
MAALPVKVQSPDKGGSQLNPKAAIFVPTFDVAQEPAIYKSAQYRGDVPSYFDDIKACLLEYDWRADVKAIYVTNGWHTEYQGAGNQLAEVMLCDYRLNDDGAAINHWYPELGDPPGTY